MPTARAFCGAAVAGRKIYVLGGYDGEKALDVNQSFSPDVAATTSEAWSQAKPMPEARYAMGVASVADMIYVVGGDGEEEKQYDSLVFVEQNKQWQEFSGISEIQEKYISLVNLGINLFVIGGKFQDTPKAINFFYKAIYTVSIPIIIK
jgi:N-acetylneuraminic acid mutarotase